MEEVMNLFLDRPVLPVGTDSLLPMAPQVVQRVQLGTSVRQPYQPNSQEPGQTSRPLGRMTSILIQQERHVPSAIPLLDQSQEFLEILLTLLLPFQKQSRPVARVERPE